MPIDTSMYANIRPVAPVQLPNPLEMVSTFARVEDVLAQTQARRLAGEKARQQAADDAALRSTVAETGGDFDQAIALLRARVPHVALALEKQVTEQRKASAETAKADLENQKTKLAHYRDIWGLVKDDASLGAIRPLFVKAFPELDPVLPTAYGDGSDVQRVSDTALTRQQQLENGHKSLELFANGKFHEALGNVLSRPDVTPEQWDQAITGFLKLGGPKAVVDEFGGVGGFSPANVANAARLAITAKDRATLEGQAATLKQTTAHQTAEEANAVAARDQAAAIAAANQAIARGQLDVARGHLAVAQAAEERQKAGKGVKLSAAQQDDVATMLTVEQLAQDVQTIDQQGGGLPGVGPVEGRFFASTRGSGGATGETLRNKIGNIQGTIAKLRGGTSFTPNEQALLETYTPTITDPDSVVRTKLATLRDFIKKKRENTLRVAAGDYTLPEAGGAPPPSTGGTTGGKQKIGRFEVEVR